MSTHSFDTEGESETTAVGERIASSLSPGAVLLLYGELGAGKTAFVRGLARGLGAPEDEVTSPTFTLLQEYRGRVTLYHADLYRLSPEEVPDLGLDDLIESGGVVAVEWAGQWHDLPAAAVEVRIDHAGGDRRRIAVTLPE